jgi:hypothetical protein
MLGECVSGGDDRRRQIKRTERTDTTTLKIVKIRFIKIVNEI